MAANKSRFDRALAAELLAAGMSKRKVADRVGGDRNTIARWAATPEGHGAIVRRQLDVAELAAFGEATEAGSSDAYRAAILTRAAQAAMGQWNPTQIQYEMMCRFLGWQGGSATARGPRAGQDSGDAAPAVHVHLGEWRPPAAALATQDVIDVAATAPTVPIALTGEGSETAEADPLALDTAPPDRAD